MSFISLAFLIFLPVTVVVHWLLPFKLRKYWLLAMSIFFYAWGEPFYVVLMIFSAVVDYCCGRVIGAKISPRASKLALLASIFVNLGLLSIFKYTDFLIGTVNALAGTSIPLQHLPLPIGISFYTFQTMSYTIDVYRDPSRSEKNFITYALYVSFFPQLVAGPIERASNLLHQFREEKQANAEDLVAGFRQILFGFFKKVCVADMVGSLVNTAFGNVAEGNGLTFWIAGMLFTVQIFCDFSGYSDIATGCARLLGIRLMKNFDRPLTAVSFREYGRRWHISLNSWFMEYVYIPLGGSRKGKFRKYLNIIIVFALSGLWHGANWTFVAWGLMIGLCTTVEDLLRPGFHRFCDSRRIDLENPVIRRVRNACVLLIVGVTSIFFRAPDIATAGTILGKMFGGLSLMPDSVNKAFSVLGIGVLGIAQIILSLILLSKGQEMVFPPEGTLFARGQDGRTAQGVRLVIYAFLILLVAVMWLMAASGNLQSQFIYFQF